MDASKRKELTDPACRNVKPLARPWKLHDVRGLFLLVNLDGSKWWRLRYTLGGKDGLLSLGVYPDVSLVKARKERDAARVIIAEGISPAEHRRQQKLQSAESAANSFEAVAKEWIAKNLPTWAPGHASKIVRRMEKDVFPPPYNAWHIKGSSDFMSRSTPKDRSSTQGVAWEERTGLQGSSRFAPRARSVLGEGPGRRANFPRCKPQND